MAMTIAELAEYIKNQLAIFNGIPPAQVGKQILTEDDVNRLIDCRLDYHGLDRRCPECGMALWRTRDGKQQICVNDGRCVLASVPPWR